VAVVKPSSSILPVELVDDPPFAELHSA